MLSFSVYIFANLCFIASCLTETKLQYGKPCGTASKKMSWASLLAKPSASKKPNVAPVSSAKHSAAVGAVASTTQGGPKKSSDSAVERSPNALPTTTNGISALSTADKATKPWSQVPSDVLEHHLQRFLVHPSSIKVMRLVCKHYSQCLRLPLVRLNPVGENNLLALNCCISAEISFYSYETVEELMSLLNRNTRLRSLKLKLEASCSSESLRVIAAYIGSPHDQLEELSIIGHYLDDDQLEIIADALKKQKSITDLVVGAHKSQDAASYMMELFAELNIRKLHWDMPSMFLESAAPLASWIASPACSLRELWIQFKLNEEAALEIFDAVKLNRSLRVLRLPPLRGFIDEGQIFDSIAQQGQMEKLSIQEHEFSRLRPLLNMLMSCKQLEPQAFPLDVDQAFSDATPEDYQMLYRYISSPHCFKYSTNLYGFIRPCIDDGDLADAWKKNSTLLSLCIDLGTFLVTEFNCVHILEQSTTLKHLEIVRIEACKGFYRDAFVDALKKSKALEILDVCQKKGSRECDPAWMKTFFSATKYFTKLRELRIARQAIAKVGGAISASILSMPNLRVLHLTGSLISEASLVHILRAASHSKELKELKMDEIEFSGNNDEDEGLDAALELVLTETPLEILSMRSVEWFYTTFDMIYSFLDASSTISLRILDLTDCNVDGETRKGFKDLTNKKSGLITVYF
jgi:hypothetical protein